MRRVSEFDALRGLAALGVLIFHLRPVEGTWTYFGMTGVHLFLVLSGFLITGIVLRHLDSPDFFKAFYARRILRIWPVYFVTLGFLVLFQHGFPKGTAPPGVPVAPSLRGLPYFLTFTQNMWKWPGLGAILPTPPGETVYAFEHSWTLAIEEQFYLIWPLAIALVSRRFIVPFIGVILISNTWFKTLRYDTQILPSVVGAFALGGLIAAMLQDKARVARFRPLLSLFFLISGLAGFAYVRWYYTQPAPEWMWPYGAWRDSLQNMAFYTMHFGIVGFVATNAGAKFLAPLRMKELGFLGEISYGMYFYHLPIYWLVDGYWIQHSQPWTMGACKIGLTFVAAVLSYHYLELPILRLKDYFPYDKRDRVAAEVPTPAVVAAAPSPVAGPSGPRPMGLRQPRMNYGRPGAPAAESDKAAS